MQVWHFSEQSCYPAWDDIPGALRVTQPSRYCDPATASDLLNRYLDEYVLADELGLNIMVNEHHVASTCMSPSPLITLGALARETKQARLLCLGAITSNRPDPVRVAEEYAVVDSLSRGRVEMGLVKGAGWELFASNANPVRMMDRYWEAHDLILKALTHHDEPFAWEGEYFHYRNVNVWPRCHQQPHPPVWIPANSPGSAHVVGARGYVCAAFLIGFGAKAIFEAYRRTYLETFGRPAELDRLAYMGMVVVGRDRAEADRRRSIMRRYLDSLKRIAPVYGAPPGYAAVGDFARALRGGPAGGVPRILPNGKQMSDDPTDEELAQSGILFAGTPDEVYEQITAFSDAIGGFGHLLMMGQAADLGHADTVDSLTLFGKEVYPRLKARAARSTPAPAAAPA